MMKPIQKILGAISETTLFGFLPLDILLHFVFGILITLIVKKYTKSLIKGFIACLTLAIIKEIYDSGTLVASLMESIKDITVTVIYPIYKIIKEKVVKKT